MILTTTFKVRGREYSLALDTDKTFRDRPDENFAEWNVAAEDGRVILVTVWKDCGGAFCSDGTVEVYKNGKDYEDGILLDRKSIRVRREG